MIDGGSATAPEVRKRSTNACEYPVNLANGPNYTPLDERHRLLRSGHGVIQHEFSAFHLYLGPGGCIRQQLVNFRELLLRNVQNGAACGPNLVNVFLNSFDCALRNTDHILDVGKNCRNLRLQAPRHNEEAYQHSGLNYQGHRSHNYKDREESLLVHVGAESA